MSRISKCQSAGEEVAVHKLGIITNILVQPEQVVINWLGRTRMGYASRIFDYDSVKLISLAIDNF
jgi:hypothetical protein